MIFCTDDFLAIKYENVVEPASNMGTVIFPFRHPVMETGLLVNVSPSPVNESCVRTLSGMAVTVSCSDLTNGAGYTVTLTGTLTVEETLLPFTFSESFTPTSSPPAPSTTGLWLKVCVDMSWSSLLIVCTPFLLVCICVYYM